MRPTPEMAAAAQKVGAGAQSRSLAMAAMSALAGVVLVAVVMMSHSSGMVGTETTPVELQMAMLRQAVTEKLSQEKKCGASCVAKKAMVAQQMKELRDQIQHDYHSMVTFGDKAGYVPPPRSIKAQVMDGSLLGGGSSGPAPPPAFKPVVGKASAFGEDKEKKLLASEEPDASSSSGSSILPPVQSVNQMASKFMKETPSTASTGGVDFMHPDSGPSVTVHHSHSSRKESRSESKGRAKWAKEFSFVKNHGHGSAPAAEHERGPKNAEPAVVRRAMQKALSFELHRSKTEAAGDKLLGLNPHEHHHTAKKGDPLQGSKFLRDYFGDSR